MNWMAPLRFLYPTANVFGAVKNVVRISYRVESNKPRNAWRKHWKKHKLITQNYTGGMGGRAHERNKQQQKEEREKILEIPKGFGIIWLNNITATIMAPNHPTQTTFCFWPMFARKTHLSFDKRKRQPGSKQINNWNDEDKSNGQSNNAGKKRRKKERKYCFEKNKNMRCKELKKEERERVRAHNSKENALIPREKDMKEKKISLTNTYWKKYEKTHLRTLCVSTIFFGARIFLSL